MTVSAEQRSKEARLGVVMYGGVSLAIYINGVSQELFRAVQGQGIYKLLKVCFDTDIVVDIVSGTSAGGINGLLLAYALANGKDFASTKELWRESGDIELLMQEANTKPQSCKSLLNSDEYYRAKLAEAFLKIDRQDFDGTGCAVSEFNEMDVFITGTTFLPDIYTTFDDAGRAIEMQDYRKVFRLKHRAQRAKKGAFRPAENEKAVRFQALAKLARITSCFPGAFLPVRVLNAEDWERRDPTREKPPLPRSEMDVDALLSEWGALKKSCYFLDGGVLDNKPFTPTIGAIFGRTADRPIDRILFYVEPDPEVVPPSEGAPSEPTFLSAVIGGVVGISTYQSVTDDAKLIEEHNSQVVRHSAVCEELQGKLNSIVGTAGIPADLAEPQRTLYISARNTQLASRAIKGLLWNSETGTGEHLTSAADRETVKSLFHSLNETRKSSELSYDETFQSYDIYFRQRRLQHVVNWLYERLRQPNQAEAQTIRQLLKGLNQHIQLLEIVQYWFEYALDRISVEWRSAREKTDPWTEMWAQVSVLVKQMLAAQSSDSLYLPELKPAEPNWLSAAELDKVSTAMGARAKRILNSDKNAATAPHAPETVDSQGPKKLAFDGLLQWTDRAETAFFEAHKTSSTAFESAQKEYTQFAGLDAIVFPLNYLSNLVNQNEVRLLRISPEPTVNQGSKGIIGFRADACAEDKLAGTRLGHFAGFLKRSWRSNDILWGRLDGLRHVVLALFTPERLKQLAADAGLRQKIRAIVGDTAGLRNLIIECFPHSPSASHDKLTEFIGQIMSVDGAVPPADMLYEHLDLLVQMGQLEIIAEEVPVVLQDAAVQQSEWNRFRRASESKHGHAKRRRGSQAATTSAPALPQTTFASPPGFIDPALVGLQVTEELARLDYFWKSKDTSAADPKQTGLGNYFERTYDVAGEGLERGIPPLILVQQMTRLLLVLNACLLGSLPIAMQDRVQGNWLYKLSLSLPLKVSFRLTTLWIREPKTTAISLTSFLAASMVAFGLACYFISGQLMHKVPGTFTSVGLVVVPFIVLVISLVLLLKKRKFAL